MKKSAFLMVAAITSAVSLSAQTKEHLYSIDAKNISQTVSPKEDFFNYVVEGWRESHPLTPEYSRYGQFNVLNDSSNNRVQRIVTGLAATNPQPGTNAYKVAAIYEMSLDSVRRNQLGAKPLQAWLKKIEATPATGMTDLFYQIHKTYGNPFFSAGPMEDLNNSSQYAMYVSGGGMTLGDRDYYLLNDKRNKEVREAYKQMMNRMLQLAGYSNGDAKRIVKNVMKIETALADSAWTREQSRNMLAMNNPRTMAQLKKDYPNIPWDGFFETTMGLNGIEDVIVTELSCLNQANRLMASTSDREKKDYYIWQSVRHGAPYLSDDFSDASFEFNKVMSGVQSQRPRWKRALGATEDVMGEAIGQLYVDQYFPESSKKYMENLVENLRTALGKHIMNLSWMSEDTKLNALKKLFSITVKIGYPDKWKDYSALNIDPSLSYYDNMMAAQEWMTNQELAKWGKPVDRTEWGMLPQTINAYYNPMNNEIVFPAGILQAPFFDPKSSDAENYGGIGVVIGHEMTHGFDDQGRMFDMYGNMTDWWTPSDSEAFDNLTQGLIKQFDEVEILPGLKANGQYTLGENIADQGGLRVARTAFLDSQKAKGVDVTSTDASIDGFDPMQVFYMNYANIWAQNIRDAEKRSLTTGDVHSLSENRVNVTLRNFEPFFEAFGIKEGDKLYRPESERVIIW